MDLSRLHPDWSLCRGDPYLDRLYNPFPYNASPKTDHLNVLLRSL